VHQLLDDTIREYGERALTLSKAVAVLPQVVAELKQAVPRPENIDPMIETLRSRTGADFIVVADLRGIRLSHPKSELIGKSMLTDDNRESSDETPAVLAGREVVSVSLGHLGRSVRGKVPILDRRGKVIGLVSSGYLLPQVETVAAQVSWASLPWFGLALILALLSSMLISRRIKREILGLEPEEIATLMIQHQAVLETMHDGVLVLGNDNRVRSANPRSRELLASREVEASTAAELWPELSSSGLLEEDGAVRNAALNSGSRPLLVDVFRAKDGLRVVIIRDREEVTRLGEELTQTRQYAELLRAQTHEFMNRLHTIGGLIQLNQSDEALALIQHERQKNAALQSLIADIGVPKVAALVIGKSVRAGELGISFGLEPGSNLSPRWGVLADEVLVLAVGNLVENAFEAVAEAASKKVSIMMGEDPEGLQLEVSDSGPGVDPALARRIFEAGVSSRGEGRGLGLSLVRERVGLLGGRLAHFRRHDRTVFQVSLPLEALREEAGK
jgi:two-component system CitB family sensor kinase